ncbi:MAG: hypothetical protein FWF11_01680, partial [Coriobacteriia bacterium]|nr:hypothetical protein [Coriobacteriia bacterium]
MNFFRHIPLAISGLALALASLGNLIAYHGGLFAEPASTYLRYGFGALALLALLLFIARIVTDPKGVREDVRSPVVLSVLPTSTMATIMLSLYLQPYAPAAAKVIWATAAVIQLCIMACFVKRFVLRFQLTNVYPSWFVAAVGIQAVAIASPYMDALVVGQAAFWLGFSLFFA